MAGFFENLFGGGAAKEAAEKNRQAANQYAADSFGFLDTALPKSEGALNNAIGAFSPLAQLGKKYGAGTGLLLDSLGANGAAGNARAVNAFQAGPGYDFALNQGLDALNRTAAARGMLGGGNLSQDSIKYATGLANQTYGDWQNRLAGLVSPELQATGSAAAGQASGYGGLSSLYQNDASNRVNVAGNKTGAIIGANNLQAQGEMAGMKNLLGAGLGLANLFAPGGGNALAWFK